MGRNARLKRERNVLSTRCERRAGKTALGNFGIFCKQTGFLVDSASTPEEADRFCEYMNQRLKKYPLIDPSKAQWIAWIYRYQEWSPDANMMCTDLDRLEKDDSGISGDLVLHSELMDSLSNS